MISVASIDSNGALSSWSNYGVGTVQLAAPGVEHPQHRAAAATAYDSGTSMAAPFVTGTVALVEAAHPTWSMSQVIDAVVDHTTPDPALAGLVTTGGVLNAAAAVANTDGAYVTSATPNGSGTSASPLSSVQVTFNEEINPATFTPSQVTLTGPGGTISGVTVTAVAGSNDHQFAHLVPLPDRRGDLHPEGRPRPSRTGTATRWTRTATASTARPPTRSSRLSAPATATLVKSEHHDAGQLDRHLRLAGLQHHRQRRQLPRLRHRHTRRPDQATPGPPAPTDPRALQTPGGTGRIAACWYSAPASRSTST